MKREPNIVVISDVHLGSYSCHAAELFNYLQSIQPEILVINGDGIDIRRVRGKKFPKQHLAVIKSILEMSRNGTKVYYVTGNHDDLLRSYADFSTDNVYLRNKLVLQIKNKRIWIFHGDVLDLPVRYSPFLYRLGKKSYDLLIVVNRLINRFRIAIGLDPMSLATKIKKRVKKAVHYVENFERTAIELAAKHNYDNVVCGHTHRPCIRVTQRAGKSITYLNAGDWVENLTALEYQCGNWHLYHYNQVDYQPLNKRLAV